MPPAAQASQRAPFVGWSTLLGIGLYGWSLPRTLNIDPNSQTRAFVGTYMLTVAASFIVPYMLTSRQPVSDAQVNLAFYGATRGIWHGVLAGGIIAGDLTPDHRSRGWAASMLAGSLVELLLGYHLSAVVAPTAGRAHTVAAGGDFGLMLGFGAGYFLRFDQKETADQQARAMAAAGLVGSAVGLAGGWALGRARDNTWGDAEVLRTSWILGAVLGASTADLARRELSFQSRTVVGLMMGGGALGLVAGDQLVRDADFGVGESLLIDLGTAAGGMVGAGVTYLAIQGDGPYLFSFGVGATVGFALTYWVMPGRVAPVKRHRQEQGGTLVLAPLLDGGTRGLSFAGRW
jgi:hypothetical protein